MLKRKLIEGLNKYFRLMRTRSREIADDMGNVFGVLRELDQKASAIADETLVAVG
jgi:hypothetical protein